MPQPLRLLLVTLLLALTPLLPLAAAQDEPKPGEKVVIVTNDNQRYEGKLVSSDENQVVVEVSNINTPIKREAIRSLSVPKSPEQRYQEARAQIEDDNLRGRYALAYTLYREEHYALAKKELEDLTKRFPDAQNVKSLLNVVNRNIELRERENEGTTATPSTGETETENAPANGGGGQTTGTPPDRGGSTTSGGGDAQLLTDEQINTIRLWELPSDLSEARPAVVVPRETIEKLFDKYRDSPAIQQRQVRDVLRQQGWEQLDLIFGLRAREFYNDVTVRQDPPAMQEFRRSVYPQYVARYLRDTFSGKIDGFELLGPQRNTEGEIYTNFLRLTQFETPEGKMIDRREPERSLMLQWGLPRDEARVPAPDVENWRPFFNSPNDPRFQNYVEWIETLFDNADYGISTDDADSEATEDGGDNRGA